MSWILNGLDILFAALVFRALLAAFAGGWGSAPPVRGHRTFAGEALEGGSE
jgi:hypothetical protein